MLGKFSVVGHATCRCLLLLQSLAITRIAVAHRPATLEAAERVLAVQGGHVVDPIEQERARAAQAELLAKINAAQTVQPAPDRDSTEGAEDKD